MWWKLFKTKSPIKKRLLSVIPEGATWPWQLLLKYPQYVSGIVVSGASHGWGGPVAHQILLAFSKAKSRFMPLNFIMRKIVIPFSVPKLPEESYKNYVEPMCNYSAFNFETFPQWVKVFNDNDWKFFLQSIPATCPVLFLNGESDWLSCREQNKYVTLPPNAKLQMVKGAGHTIVWSHPKEYSEAVRDFYQNECSHVVAATYASPDMKLQVLIAPTCEREFINDHNAIAQSQEMHNEDNNKSNSKIELANVK